MKRLVRGDIVTLRSGGQRMVVLHEHEDGYRVSWRNDGGKATATFPATELKLVVRPSYEMN